MNYRRSATCLCLVVALGCWAAETSAQQVHLLMAGDTDDPKIGRSVQHDLGSVAVAFYILLREGQLDNARLEGDRVSAENILQAIDRFRVGPDDALVFYWSGHGAFDRDGHFLHLPKGGNLYRSTLLGAMKKKKPRLVVLLTDCCNEYADTTSGKPMVAPSSPDPKRKTSPLFEELFLKPRGVVDVNAAAQGEVALGVKEGGLFTLSLVCMAPEGKPGEHEGFALDKAFGAFWRNSQRRVSWQTVLSESRSRVQTLFRQMYPEGIAGPENKIYQKQTVVAWSLPEEPKPQPQADRGSRFGVEAVDNNGEGVRVVRVWPGFPGTKVAVAATGQMLQLQSGDVILAVNGRPIRNTKDYWDAVKGSPQTMDLTVRDVRDGQKRELRTRLRH